MPRAQIKTVSAAPADRYPTLSRDPVDSLAEQVGRFVAAEVKQFRLPPLKGRHAKSTGAEPAGDMQRLEAEIARLISRAIHSSLCSQTAEGKAIRMGLIARLAKAELGSGASAATPLPPTPDTLLTTAQAAEQLEVSRPYISMLCDQGKLGDVVITEGGHRRIRSSAVHSYLAARTQQHEGSPSPRAAAEAAGLYEFPDGHFKNVVRDTSAPILAPRSKASRKTRP